MIIVKFKNISKKEFFIELESEKDLSSALHLLFPTLTLKENTLYKNVDSVGYFYTTHVQVKEYTIEIINLDSQLQNLINTRLYAYNRPNEDEDDTLLTSIIKFLV